MEGEGVYSALFSLDSTPYSAPKQHHIQCSPHCPTLPSALLPLPSLRQACLTPLQSIHFMDVAAVATEENHVLTSNARACVHGGGNKVQFRTGFSPNTASPPPHRTFTQTFVACLSQCSWRIELRSLLIPEDLTSTPSAMGQGKTNEAYVCDQCYLCVLLFCCMSNEWARAQRYSIKH